MGAECSRCGRDMYDECDYCKLRDERDRYRLAIQRHRHNIWGDGEVEHGEDRKLYETATLAQAADRQAFRERAGDRHVGWEPGPPKPTGSSKN